MQPGEAVSRSALDKPLHLLTEDDISQLTREDCRRFLIQKGMRRPSWNKSQAIQQVISLKALLETTSDSNADGEQGKLQNLTPKHGHSDSDAPDTEASVLNEESVPNPDVSGDKIADPQNDSVSPRFVVMTVPKYESSVPAHALVDVAIAGMLVNIVEVTNEPVGQMTIFYSGKVNVFDDISGEKARIIMQLAASPLFLPHAAPSEVISALWPFQSQLQAAGIKLVSTSPTVISQKLQTDKDQVHREGNNKSPEDNPATSRKASVQRFLEKKKDRFKHKGKVAVPSSASLDVYLNHVEGDQLLTAQLNLSDATSPSQPQPPQMPTRSNSVGNNYNK
ncbi:Protein TIFY 4A [Morus notabilis]|uniref:Protein TIFY n=1 Tax=Morus notabilis TaxID=981085 RepID=W9SEG9_9ROSA|nr:Protein TIFY 4A [Morus notabilis]